MEKMAQAQEVMKDILAAERKKREEREQAAQAPADTDAKTGRRGNRARRGISQRVI